MPTPGFGMTLQVNFGSGLQEVIEIQDVKAPAVEGETGDTTVHKSPEGAIRMDPTGRKKYANAEAKFFFIAGNAIHEAIEDAANDLVGLASAPVWKVTWPDDTWHQFAGWPKGFTRENAQNGHILATVPIEVTGPVTRG